MILLITLMLFGQVDSMYIGLSGDQDVVLRFVEEDSPSISYHAFDYACSVEDGITIYKTSDAWTARELIGMYEYSKDVMVVYCSTYTGGSSKDKGISFISTLMLILIPSIILAAGYLAGFKQGRKQ